MVLDAIFADSSSLGTILLGIVGGVLLVLFVLGLCTCSKLKPSTALDGVLVEGNGIAVTQEPTANKPCGNGAVTLSASEVDIAKLKVPTLQRKLPDIPVLPVSVTSDNSENATETQSPDTGSELYATVDASTKTSTLHPSPLQPLNALPQDVKTNVEEMPEASTSFHNPAIQQPAAAIAAADALTKQLGETTQSSGDSDAEHPYSHIQPHNYLRLKHADHPYDWLKGQTSEERDTDTDNYDDPQVYAQSREWTVNEPPPPPVPEKRYDIDNNTDDLQSSAQPTAANAVSGRVSASDIPYVTSPIDSPTHQQPPVPELRPVSPLIEPQYNGSETSTGSGPNVRYTSISVREPLANLRAQPQPVQESYYAVVSDDDIDQTYAEIHAGQTTSSESPAYTTVDFTASNRELPPVPPPVPPPVESLRSLRSNHSGQESISSNISDSTLHGVSALATMNETSSVSSFADSNELYSTIEKRRHPDRSADRKTIHTSVPHSYLQLDNIEDMYAKVLKNKRLSLHQDFASSDGLPSASAVNASANYTFPTNPPSSPLPFPLQLDEAKLWSFSDSRRPRSMIAFGSSNRTVMMSSSSAHNVSEFKGSDPGYEEVRQPDAAMDQVDGAVGGDPGYERIREKFTNGSADPGYETVKGNDACDPGYETVMLTSLHNGTSDPAYETVNIHAVNHLKVGYEIIGSNQSDPGYEQIRKNYVDSEPGYETITHATNGSETGYERINPVVEEAVEPGYERINLENVTDPGYEQVNPRVVQPDIALDYKVMNYSDVDNSNSLNGHVDRVTFNDPGYEEVKFRDSAELSTVEDEIKVVVVADEISSDNNLITTENVTHDLTTLQENGISSVELKINHATMNYIFDPCYDTDDRLELQQANELPEIVDSPYAVVNKSALKMMEIEGDIKDFEIDEF